MFQLHCGALTMEFPPECGGLPGKVTVREGDGRTTALFQNNAWHLELEREDGLVLHPVAEERCINVYETDGVQHLDFINMHFADGAGKLYGEYYLVLRHEFYADGTAFTNMYFFVRDVHTPGIVRFELTAKPDFSTFDHLRWNFRERPATVDGTLVTAQCERFLAPGDSRKFTQIIPDVAFSATRDFAPSLYAELFVEGESALSNRRSDVESEIKWQGNAPALRWSFQNKAFPRPLINQLRNQWGWVIRPAQTERHLPPLKMYHYFDNYRRYPSEEQIKAIIASGCDLLIMHENWRCDTQNDGVPFEPEKFIRLRDALHAAGIRLACYIRGVEESVVARQAQWFRQIMTYNVDGLYMDYGSPFGRLSQPDESYCGGRILFRDHYYTMKRVREMIGPDAPFFSHTGPSFSAMSMPFMSGYVSGEGERGMLIRGREEYEYFSMAPVAPGTLWSAAFPEYSSPQIVPFIASAGQYPHSPLGGQFLSSSLVHPPAPGINDAAFDPLWRLWSVVRKERDLHVVNDYNSSDCFAKDRETGHYCFVSKSKNLALLIVGNFGSSERKIDAAADWKRCGFDAEKFECRLLQQGRAELCSAVPQSLTLGAYEVAAVLLTVPELDAETLLADYLRPVPSLCPECRDYLAKVEAQRKLRTEAPAWKSRYLKIVMPELSPTPYEDSMSLDLFDNAFELLEKEAEGKYRHICWIDRNGVADKLDPKQNLFAGVDSPAVKLGELLPAGVHHLALYSTHFGMPFYNFCYADLAPDEKFGGETRRVEFLNDLEPDRAYLHFVVNI